MKAMFAMLAMMVNNSLFFLAFFNEMMVNDGHNGIMYHDGIFRNCQFTCWYTPENAAKKVFLEILTNCVNISSCS